MNSEQKKGRWLKNTYWLLPAAIALIAVLLMLLPAYWIGSLPAYTGRIEQSEKQRKIVTYTIQTPKGEIVVTELRSGTEFNRILQMPDGKVVPCVLTTGFSGRAKNCLLNPKHPDFASAKLTGPLLAPIDPRLIKFRDW